MLPPARDHQHSKAADTKERGCNGDSTSDVSRLEELVNSLPLAWPAPRNLHDFSVHLSNLNMVLLSCTEFGDLRIRSHILWKLALLYLHQPELADIDWRIAPPAVWAWTLPDPPPCRLNEPALTAWQTEVCGSDILDLVPTVPPTFLYMWAGQFQKALRGRHVVEWVAQGDARTFQEMAASIRRAQGGCPPRLSQVLARAVSLGSLDA